MELTGWPLLVLLALRTPDKFTDAVALGAYFEPIIDDTYSHALSPTLSWFDELGAFAGQGR